MSPQKVLNISFQEGFIMSRARKLAEKRQIAHAALDDFARVAHDDLRPYKVMIYGFGQIAEAGLFFTLARSDILCPLEISIVGYARPDTEKVRRSLLRWEQKEGVIVNPHVPIHPLLTSEVPDVISSIDLCVVTADRVKHRTEDRIATCRGNLPIANDIAQLVRINDKTHFDIVTNLGELLSYKIWKDTNCDPYRLFSNAHVDKLRLDAFILEYLSSAGMPARGTDAFVVGTHQNPWPVVNDMRVNTGHEYINFGNLGARIQRELQQRIAGYAGEQIRLKKAADASGAATLHESGVAIADVIASFVNRGGLVNCGLFRGGKYILGPTDFAEGTARPSEDLLSRMTATDRVEFELRERMLDSWITELELDKPARSVHPVPAYPVALLSPASSYQPVAPLASSHIPVVSSSSVSPTYPVDSSLLYERVSSTSSVQFAVFGAALLTLAVAGVAVVGHHQTEQKQREEKGAQIQTAQLQYETDQKRKSIALRLNADAPQFVRYVFGGRDTIQLNMFKLNLADVETITYTSSKRGLFIAKSYNLKPEHRIHAAQGHGSVLAAFYERERPSIDVLLTGQLLEAPVWRGNDAFDITGICALREPFDIGNWNCRVDFLLPGHKTRYHVTLNPDNTLRSITEKK